MKALIRNPGETVPEDCGLSFINWQNGAPLTNPDWYGGPYILVENYVPPKDDESESYDEVVEPDQVIEENDDEYVIIDGKKYSKAELRSLIE